MTIRNLDYLFKPKSVAVIGASNREGSLGAVLTRNLLRGGLETAARPVTTEQIAATFKGARRRRVDELLETLVSIGQARMTEDGRYTSE